MGYEFERVNDDQKGQDPSTLARNLLHDAQGFFGKAKNDFDQKFNTQENRDKLQQFGQGLSDQAQDLGRKYKQQGEQMADEAQRQAGGLLKNQDFGGKLGDIFGKATEPFTKKDTAEFCQTVRENFSKLDKDGNGFIDRDEIKAASKDFLFRVQNSYTLGILDKRYDDLRNCSNDEWFSESKGISLADINALDNARKNGTGFGAYMGAALDGITSSPTASIATGLGTAGIAKFAYGASTLKAGGIGLGSAALLMGSYGALDYYTSRKDHITSLLTELG